MAMKQPILALITVIAWLWLAVSLAHGFAHGCEVASAALAQFFQQ